MGGSFSKQTLKVQLKMSNSRMDIFNTKREAEMRKHRKEISSMLEAGKESSARIRCEAVIRIENQLVCTEILALMTELLGARLGLIASSKTCSPDILEAVATVIYCGQRMGDALPELRKITQQLALRWTEKWVRTHIQNDSGCVNPRIIDALSVKPPNMGKINAVLAAVATEHGVAWAVEESAQQEAEVQPDRKSNAVKQPVNLDNYPGMFTLQIARANLHDGSLSSPYVRLTSIRNGESSDYKDTPVNPNPSTQPGFWQATSFPFTVRGPDTSVLLHLYNESKSSDVLVASCTVQVDLFLGFEIAQTFTMTGGDDGAQAVATLDLQFSYGPYVGQTPPAVPSRPAQIQLPLGPRGQQQQPMPPAWSPEDGEISQGQPQPQPQPQREPAQLGEMSPSAAEEPCGEFPSLADFPTANAKVSEGVPDFDSLEARFAALNNP
jgi:vacuolar protein sorting-associated protein IST1